MHAEGEEPLLGGVVEIAPDPAPLGVGGGESARLGAPELALEPSRLDGEQRRRGSGVDELRVLGEGVIGVEGGDGQAVASDFRPLPARDLERSRQLAALRVAEVSGGGIPVAEPQRRVVECVGHDRVPARRSGPVRELAQEAAEDLAGEEIRLKKRDREADRKHDPHADEQPGERVVGALADPDHEHGEVEDEERRHEERRGRGDGDERPPLRSRRCPETPEPDRCDDGDDGQPDVGDELRHALEQPRRRADLERIVGAGGGTRGELVSPHRRAPARGAATRRRRAPAQRPAPRATGRRHRFAAGRWRRRGRGTRSSRSAV